MLILYSATLLNLFISSNVIAFFFPFLCGFSRYSQGLFLGVEFLMSQGGSAVHISFPWGRTQEGVCQRREEKL